MDPTFERFHNKIMRFLEEAQSGVLSNEDEEHLKILADVARNLENLQETGDFDQTATLKNVCQEVLYGNYICLKNNAAVMSKKFNEVREAESQGAPEVLQPKIKEIKGYFAKLRELITDMDNLAKKISNKINDLCARDFELTESDRSQMKTLNIAFETAVKNAADFYDQADCLLKRFESDVVSYKKKARHNAAIFGGFAILAAAFTGGLAGGLIGAVMGAAGGGSVACLVTNSIYSKQCEKLEIKCRTLNCELRHFHLKKADIDRSKLYGNPSFLLGEM